MNMRKIAIVGDRFMLPEIFESAVAALPDKPACDIKSLQLKWPDEPMRNDERQGICEFVGDPDEIGRFVGDAEIMINHVAPVTADTLRHTPNLKMMVVARGGPVNVDMAALARRGIAVANTPGRNASAVAEFIVGMILSETRRIRAGHESLRGGKWRGDLYRADLVGEELCDLTVGIVGYGKIGGMLSDLLKPFGCRMLAVDPYVDIRREGVEQAPLQMLLRESDVIVLNARVTPETTRMINREQLRQMKPTALLINTARGPLVNYDALCEALDHGGIAAASLDTFAVEPLPPDSPLLRMPNVTITPHIAGASKRTIQIAAENAAEEIRRYFSGEPPVNPVFAKQQEKNKK